MVTSAAEVLSVFRQRGQQVSLQQFAKSVPSILSWHASLSNAEMHEDELDLLPFCFSSCWPYSFGLHDREAIAPGTSLEVRVPQLQVPRPGVLIVFDARDRIAVALLSHGSQKHGSPPGLPVIIYLFHGASTPQPFRCSTMDYMGRYYS